MELMLEITCLTSRPLKIHNLTYGGPNELIPNPMVN